MKFPLRLFIIGLIIIFPKSYFAQQFGPEIIIDENNVFEPIPAIDIDSQGNIGIIWWNKSISTDSIKFIKSYDGGVTFSGARIVDTLPYNPDAGIPETHLIRFDEYDNPIVFYERWSFPFSYFHFSKKSMDGGNSFPSQRYSFLSRNWHVEFLNVGSDTSFLAYSTYSTRNVMVKRSVNGGVNYSDSTLLYTGNGEPFNIALAKCFNADILCFYSRYDEVNYNRSADLGLTFSNNIPLESPYEIQGMGDVKSYQDKLFNVYVATIDTPEYSRKIVFDKSEDNGYTYGNNIVLHDWGDAGIYANINLQMVFNPNVGICILWTDYLGAITEKTWLLYSDDFGETFYPPILVTEGKQWTTKRAMAVSDSGDVYVTYFNCQTNKIVLRKAKLPVLTAISSSNVKFPEDVLLIGNYPNPFNPATTIYYELPNASKVKLEVYNLLGQNVRTLINVRQEAGRHQIVWDGENDFGLPVASGIYIYRFQAGNYSKIMKMILMK